MKICEGFMSDMAGKITSFWKVATSTTPKLKQKNNDFFTLYDEMVKEYEHIFNDLLQHEDVVANYGKDLPTPEEMALTLMKGNVNTLERRIRRNARNK